MSCLNFSLSVSLTLTIICIVTHANRTLPENRLYDCGEDQFDCGQGQCINASWRCNGYRECQSGADESCSALTCNAEQFKCANGRCITKSYVCDGDNDCGDRSDEDPGRCVYRFGPNCGPNGFRCANKACIPLRKLCNNITDCADGSDEKMGFCRYECPEEHGCEHYCIMTLGGEKCGCEVGYELREDEKHCRDRDECSIPGFCSQNCQNLIGGFNCSCESNYILTDDGRYCKANGTEAEVVELYSRKIVSRGLQSGRTTEVIRFAEESSTRTIDFDVRTATVFGLERTNGTLFRISEWNHQSKVLLQGLEDPKFLSWDWIGQNFYFVTNQNEINVCNSNATFCALLIKTQLPTQNVIQSFTLAPHRMLMFWSHRGVWGHPGRIDRANMDGSGQTNILITNVSEPVQLTVDWITDDLYWIEKSHGQLFASNMNGKNRREIMKENGGFGFIAVFEDYIYAYNRSSLMRVNKFQRQVSEAEHVPKMRYAYLTSNPLIDMKIAHVVQQPQRKNPCRKHLCEHLCLLKPEDYTCACHIGYRLAEDGHNCVKINNVSTKSQCQNVRCRNGGTCADDVDESGMQIWRCHCRSGFTGRTCESSSQAIEDRLAPNGRESIVDEAASSKNQSDGGSKSKAIMIVVGVVLFVVTLIAIGLFVGRRHIMMPTVRQFRRISLNSLRLKENQL